MKKKYIYILITFIIIQLSGLFGSPLVFFIGSSFFDVEPTYMKFLAAGIWIVFSFALGLIIILLLLRKAVPFTKVEKAEPMPIGRSITWAIGGVFLAFLSQIIAVLIERALGINPVSENTQLIMKMITLVPMVVIASSLLGPILEEIVFRKVIFGTLYNRFPFWVSALISAIVFSLAHQEPEHLLLYAAMGFTFSYLYVKTKRIIVPIISHMAMNTLVTVVQINELKKQASLLDTLFGWIGGGFL
ncbi:CPBP family intramembrane glutamic endopeptidase [Bacillus sp. FJAT-50079]|uniref:CPBP family intramembrane glutamic endopeptidase n=1 Tax=Bacillus sp. FJAT-50079 TaxID=2833577 RepID=UPI001BC8E926|nr:CPBP family intramembrane glutamic endopeptidase [Bacillus sp. FJAT-50079]MBS4210436.1 CPBP family intramembrane metalloprotease [Bacillus sp. FJAT-50079]